MSRDPNLVTRKVYFYRVQSERDAAQRPVPFARARLRSLADLRFDDGSAYLEADDRVTCGWLDRDTEMARVRVADIRRQYLPSLERMGQLGRLEIDDDAGLAEQVHVAFFPNDIVGSEFNFYGPRMTRVGYYLTRKLGGAPIRFEPLVRRDVVRELDRLVDIRLFQLRLHPSYIDETEQVDSNLFEALRSARALGESGRVEVVIRPVPRSRQALGGQFHGIIRRLLGRPAINEGADIFRTAGRHESGDIRELDLLRDTLAVERQVRREERTRSLDQTSIYTAIESAYEELREELEAAASMSD